MSNAGNVLVIDDEEVVRAVLERILTKEGNQVSLAATGQEGIAKIKEQGFNLIMLDLKLPDFSGIEVLKQIREKSPEIEVIIMTGFASYETAVDALKEGAYDYIEKPFSDINQVANVCEKAMERGRLREENRKLTADLAKINEELKKANANLRRKMAQFATLYQLGQLLNSTSDMEKILDLSIDFLAKGFAVDCGAVMLIDGEELIIKRARGLSPGTVKDFRIKLGEGKIGKVLKEEKRVLIKDFKDDPLFQAKISSADKKEIESFFSTPLRAVNKVVGALTVFKLREGSFDEENMNIFSLFASQIAPAIRLGVEKGK